MTRLLLSGLPGETRAAWLEDDRLVDLFIQRDERPELVGNLYLGRVASVDKSLGAAFVELGLERPGFLPLGEAPGRKLGEGDSLVVKILTPPQAGKGAKLSARVAAQALETMAAGRKAPCLLARGDDPLQELLARPLDEVVVEGAALFAKVKALLAAARPELLESARLYDGRRALFEDTGLEAEIEDLLLPEVALPSGGSLLIEPVTTLTAIDVNSGAHGGGRGGRNAAEAVNLEAAGEIARQLRLRALSGLIVVDFLELAGPAARKGLVKALRAALAGDEVKTRVYPMAPSGLVEIARRRARAPLHEVLTEACGPGGRRKSAATLAFELLRRVKREALAAPGRRPAARVSPAVDAALAGTAAAARAAIEESLGRPLAVTSDPACADFEIVLE